MILKDIEQRLDKLENAIGSGNLQNDNNNQLAQLLPLTSIKDIKDLESVLKDSHEGRTKCVSIFVSTSYNIIVSYINIYDIYKFYYA